VKESQNVVGEVLPGLPDEGSTTGQRTGPNERREITRNARLTPLQARFARLPMAEALQVWDAATATEKAELSQEFIKKKTAYMRKAYNEGPEARAKDKIYRRLVTMFS